MDKKDIERWLDKHKGQLPSEYPYQIYHAEYQDSITSYPEVDSEYTLRPSILEKFDEIDFDHILEKAQLTLLESTVLTKLFYEGYTQVQLGLEFGCSQAWIYYLKRGAIKKLSDVLDK